MHETIVRESSIYLRSIDLFYFFNLNLIIIPTQSLKEPPSFLGVRPKYAKIFEISKIL